MFSHLLIPLLLVKQISKVYKETSQPEEPQLKFLLQNKFFAVSAEFSNLVESEKERPGRLGPQSQPPTLKHHLIVNIPGCVPDHHRVMFRNQIVPERLLHVVGG